MYDLLSQTPEELAGLLVSLGEPSYRAAQVFSALHGGARDAADMTALPLKLRERLAFPRPEPLTEQLSADGTRKLLFGLEDGQTVESVLLEYEGSSSENPETTVCISSQVGCGQGCAFCASALGGKARDLTAGEMLGQVLYCGVPVSRVVMMGIGEPLDNFENTVRFLRLLSHPKGLGMSLRRVTVSTCGLVPGILKLADLGLPVTLSVSLHAPDDETRNILMPVNRRYGLQELLFSCRMYFMKTGRRVSLEYALIRGVNDAPRQAAALAALLKEDRPHINLIPLNPVEGKPYRSPPREDAGRFADVLRQNGLSVTVRRRLGNDIDAACGQLRRRAAT
ncbi:MAG: 23S rRNA (adenine(2503)-C(2))-methyltransferase RlmN [Oscillospiraceae bacterium]|nr:23S rRNA (adenine(2503)-C(2))-methyltransferase RlmN [Oscillospiraceae bacterium]